MSGDEPAIDTGQLAGSDGALLITHFPAVRDVRPARAFYADVLGGRVVMEENPCIVTIAAPTPTGIDGGRADGR